MNSSTIGQVGQAILPAAGFKPAWSRNCTTPTAGQKAGCSQHWLPHVGVLFALACPAWPQATESDRVKLLEQQLAAERRLLRDWGGLTRYGSENTELRPPTAGEGRVVFLGDQVTELWGRGNAKFFPGKPYLNRGIAGQTTAQMLVRFRQDVISLQPRVVVILAGMNDITGVFGLATEEMIAENIMTMTELPKLHGIRVVLASLTPLCHCFSKPTKRPRGVEKIVETNDLLKDNTSQCCPGYPQH